MRSQVSPGYLTALYDELAFYSASLSSIGTPCHACCARVWNVTHPRKSVQLRFHRSEVSKDDKVMRLSCYRLQGGKIPPWKVKKGAMT